MTTRTRAGERWNDPKRYLWLFGLIPPTTLFIATAMQTLFNALGWYRVAPAWWWLGPFLVYGVLVILDRALGTDGENPPEELIDEVQADRYYRYCTYAYLPIQLGSVVLACYLWTADDLSWIGVDGGLGLDSKIGIAWSLGIIGGISINTAHELGHRRESLERWLSKVALAQTWYGHFFVEHERGHHVLVATPEDSSSARFGETFWQYLPRSVFDGLVTAWRMEAARMRRAGRTVVHPKNDVLNAWALTVVLWTALAAVFGPAVLPFLVVQAVLGITLLESVNYVEHYGLLRRRNARGRYERCTPQHSWNSDFLCSNIFLFQLQRHSDHHANPARRYQALRTFDDVPTMPSGYATMITLALFPPLWRRAMDSRVLRLYDGDLDRVNLCPAKAGQLRARYADNVAPAVSARSGATADRLTQPGLDR